MGDRFPIGWKFENFNYTLLANTQNPRRREQARRKQISWYSLAEQYLYLPERFTGGLMRKRPNEYSVRRRNVSLVQQKLD